MTPEPAENSPAPTQQENPYYVLRRGEILGPFEIEDLTKLVASSTLEYDDFVQQTGSSEWLPLRWLLVPNEAQDLEGAIAPTWRTLIKWSWLRLRYNLGEQSLSAGWVCLGFAMIGLFLSRWPMLLWAPWAVLAFFGGIALYRRRRPGSGIALMLCAALIPGALWAYFWSATPPVPASKPTTAPPAALPQEKTPAPKTEPPPASAAISTEAEGIAQNCTSPTSIFPTCDTPPSASAFVGEHSSELVFVSDKGTGSAGSGFVCVFREKPALFTNIHVAAGMRAPEFTRLDRSTVATRGMPAAAVGHDILHYSLPAETPMPKLRAADRVEDVASIGDEVFVLGNSEGARVIAPLSGKIVGIGPELVEVTAEFVPGNSGSPIIHAKSGMVIGIATYLSVRDKRWLSEENGDAKIRRFGYRLDSVKSWQAVDWAAFAKDRVEYEKIKQLTADLAKLLRDLKDGVISGPAHTNPAIAPHVKTFIDKVGGTTRINANDRRDAAMNLFKFMRNASQQDIAAASVRIRFDYFTRALSEEKLIRTQFAEAFDEIVKAIK